MRLPLLPRSFATWAGICPALSTTGTLLVLRWAVDRGGPALSGQELGNGSASLDMRDALRETLEDHGWLRIDLALSKKKGAASD